MEPKNIYLNNKRKLQNNQNEPPKLLADPNPLTHCQNPKKASPNTLPSLLIWTQSKKLTIIPGKRAF